ncbi:MAG TPA: Hsp33 family molecular chaperone HslO [Dongiaceae bacterium]|nr:Hsp33 family molecular chaperone HslO [Dongiaceae bacterium]
MNDSDTSQRFLLNDSAIRGQWTLLDSSFQTVLAKHTYPLEIQSLLGELMAAAVLLTATLKFDGSLTIQARGEGPVHLVTVECTDNNHLRAVARWKGDTTGLDFKSLLGNATLAITITPGRGERYQGIVPLTGNSLAECLEFYFSQSEQLRTRIWLHQGNNRAAGMLLQVLPYNSGVEIDPDQQNEDWNRLTLLANTLTADELLNLDSPTLLHRLFHEEDVLLFPPEPVDFRCTCNRERTADALVRMGREDLDAILEEQGSIEVTCQFCNHLYVFDPVDVAMLFQSNPAPDAGRRH